jgi:site-specific recombinase XerD
MDAMACPAPLAAPLPQASIAAILHRLIDWGRKMVATASEPISLLDRLDLTDELEARCFCTALMDEDRANKTICNYYSDIMIFARWYQATYGAMMRVANLTASVLLEYERHMRTELRLKPATINRRITSLRTFCRWALAEGFLKQDPSAKIKHVKRDQPAPEGLSRNERNALFRVCERQGNLRNTAMVHLMVYCGLRVGDVAKLDVRDVHLSARKGHIYVRGSKGDKDRTVHLSGTPRASLAAYVAQRGTGGPDDTHLFLSQLRRGISTDAVADVVAHYGALAGILPTEPHHHVNTHRLRHTAARFLLAAGNDLVTVGKILGHKDIKTTARYCLPTEEEMAAAMARVEDDE